MHINSTQKIIIPEQAQLDDLFLFGLIDGPTVVFSTSFNEREEEKMISRLLIHLHMV